MQRGYFKRQAIFLAGVGISAIKPGRLPYAPLPKAGLAVVCEIAAGIDTGIESLRASL